MAAKRLTIDAILDAAMRLGGQTREGGGLNWVLEAPRDHPWVAVKDWQMQFRLKGNVRKMTAEEQGLAELTRRPRSTVPLIDPTSACRA